MNRLLVCVFVLTLVTATGIDRLAAQQNESRIALIIGNAAYTEAAPLKDAVNNAQALTEELRRHGFDADIGENLTKEAMRAALDRFYGKIKSGSTALFFFSGYGVQSDRQNYMIPIDAQIRTDVRRDRDNTTEIRTEPDVRRDGYSLESVLAEMNARGARVKIAILDVPRADPFDGSLPAITGGFGPVDAPRETLVIYASSPGRANADGPDQSAFVNQLIKEIRAPGTIEDAFHRTRRAVAQASGGSQIPWMSSSLTEDFSLVTAGRSPAKPEPTTPNISALPSPPRAEPEVRPSVAADLNVTEERDWESAMSAGTREALLEFFSKHPTGRYAELARDSLRAVQARDSLRARDPFEELRLVTEKYLKSVPARYNVPDSLTYGQSKEISFVLEPQGVGTAADRLTGMPGEVVTTLVQISPHVKALLTGPIDLVEIKLRGGDDAQRKAVTLSAPVQWIWDVKAIGVGTATLQLDLISFIPDNEKSSLEVRSFSRRIPIEISLIDRAKRVVAEVSPLWAFLAAVVTAVGGSLAFFGWKPTFGRRKG
jgi:hypothetical protein